MLASPFVNDQAQNSRPHETDLFSCLNTLEKAQCVKPKTLSQATLRVPQRLRTKNLLHNSRHGWDTKSED